MNDTPDRTVDPAPNGLTRCEVCKAWMWCRGQQPYEAPPEGCDADEHGKRESAKRVAERAA